MKTKRLILVRIIMNLLPETHFFNIKNKLLRWAGIKIGRNVRICSSVRFLGNGEIEIGNDVWIGHESMIVSTSSIKIGNHVDIAPRVFIGTGTHEIDSNGPHSAGKGKNISVCVGNGVWICVNSTILPGSDIGNKTIIAAGSVVKGFLPERVIAGGNPAAPLKTLEDGEKK